MRDLLEVLKNYNINGEIISETRGPLLNIIEFQPAAGTKAKAVTAVADDIRRELGVSSLLIEPAPNGNALFFQIPAEKPETVDFQKLLHSPEFTAAKAEKALPLLLGVDVKGNPVIGDLAKMPHLLIGGTTGSGKSVGLNAFILSLVAAKTPDEVKFVLIDPKKVEFSGYNNQRYLYAPVADETAEAAALLSYLAAEMDRRYELFAENMSKNLAQYNARGEERLPYIVCVIDEFADLTALDKNVEKDVLRLAQKARAAGIHLILATQRPSVDVVTGVLKANFPTRLAYKTASSADSRTVLDAAGAEELIGRGDSLYLSPDGNLQRLHGAYVSDNTVAEILKPYAAAVKPLKLALPAAENAGKAKPKEGIFRRIWKFWTNLRQKDRDMIIRYAKYAAAYVAGFLSNRNNKNKR